MSIAENGGIPPSNLGIFTDEMSYSPEQVIRRESEAWTELLGAPVDIPTLPEFVDSQVIDYLDNLDLELRAIPSLGLPYYLLFGGNAKDPFPTGIETPFLEDREWRRRFKRFAKAAAQKYPGLPQVLLDVPEVEKETDDNEVFGEYDDDSNKFAVFWRTAAQQDAHWVALERTNRPAYTGTTTNEMESYDSSIVSKLLNVGKERRESYDSVQERLSVEGSKIINTVFNVNADNVNMRLLTPPEWMILALREGWYATNNATSEWLQEEGTIDTGLVGPEIRSRAAKCVGNKYDSVYNDDGMIVDTGIPERDEMGYRIAIDLSDDLETNFNKFQW